MFLNCLVNPRVTTGSPQSVNSKKEKRKAQVEAKVKEFLEAPLKNDEMEDRGEAFPIFVLWLSLPKDRKMIDKLLRDAKQFKLLKGFYEAENGLRQKVLEKELKTHDDICKFLVSVGENFKIGPEITKVIEEAGSIDYVKIITGTLP